MIDQASKLRDMTASRTGAAMENKGDHNVKIYSVVSGKGGVGKTNFSVNLAIKLQQSGKKTLILDADVGMSNANILMGIETPSNLFALLRGEVSLSDIIVTGPQKVDLISGGSDLFYIESLNYSDQKNIIDTLSKLGAYDVMIIDNGAGINKHSLTFTTFAHEVILITTPEPAALTDAYRVLKAISMYKIKQKVKVIVNQVQETHMGEVAFNKLVRMSNRFLGIELESTGIIYNDVRVSKAVMEQKPVVLMYPHAVASVNIDRICKNILEDKSYNENVSTFKQLGNRFRRFFG